MLLLYFLITLIGVNAFQMKTSTTCTYYGCGTWNNPPCKMLSWVCEYNVDLVEYKFHFLTSTTFDAISGSPMTPSQLTQDPNLIRDYQKLAPYPQRACTNGMCGGRYTASWDRDQWYLELEYAGMSGVYLVSEGVATNRDIVLSFGGNSVLYSAYTYYGEVYGQLGGCQVSSVGNPSGGCCVKNEDCASRNCVAGSVRGSRCQDAVCGKGDSKGVEGSCCKTVTDCRDGCFNGKCTGTRCNPQNWGTGNGEGFGDDCCRDSDDCDGSCKNGMCTAKYACDRKLNQGDGVLGDCCKTSEDCVITCETSFGKCRNSALTCSTPMTGNADACCRANTDCKSGKCPTGTCVGGATTTTKTTIGPIPTGTCIPGWCGKGTGKGPVGACCSVEGDCDDTCNANGKCGPSDGTWKQPLGCATTSSTIPTTTVGGKTCKSGYYGKGLKTGPDRYCCATTADCIGSCVSVPGDSYMCMGGATTTIPTKTTTNSPLPTIPSETFPTGCISGFEYAEDYGSADGYCCSQYAGACQGSCVGNICIGAPPQVTCACISGHEGDGNTNLSPKYCCKDGSDCLFGCTDGACVAGSALTCTKPTKTTTTTTATQTGKPKPTSVDLKDICVGICGPPNFPKAVGLPGLVIGFIGVFVPLLDDDDDTTTTTTTTKTTTTSTTSSTSTTTSSIISSITYSTTPGSTGPTNTFSGTTTSNTTISSTSAGITGTNTPTNTNVTTPTNTDVTVTPTNGTVNPTITESTTVVLTTNATFTISPTEGTLSTGTISTTSVTIPTSDSTTSFSPITTVTTSSTSSNSSSRTSSSSTTSSTRTTSGSTTSLSTGTITTVTTSGSSTSVVTSPVTTTTAIPTGKTCKSGYYNKNLKNAPDGSCCATSADCIGDCVYIPGDSYMCKSGSTTVTLPTSSSTPKPTPTCTSGHCGLGLGKGLTGACCADHWDCDDTCNGNGKCGVSDGTWTKKLVCP